MREVSRVSEKEILCTKMGLPKYNRIVRVYFLIIFWFKSFFLFVYCWWWNNNNSIEEKRKERKTKINLSCFTLEALLLHACLHASSSSSRHIFLMSEHEFVTWKWSGFLRDIRNNFILRFQMEFKSRNRYYYCVFFYPTIVSHPLWHSKMHIHCITYNVCNWLYYYYFFSYVQIF